MPAKEHSFLREFTFNSNITAELGAGHNVLIEVPQGVSLGLNQGFYPFCTSRECTVMQAMADAQIHPHYLNNTMLVLRTFPIRVGNIVSGDQTLGHSGDCYRDQRETSWEDLGVEPEITTVTKRVRRVFTWSHLQALKAMELSRPNLIYLSHCDYIKAGQMIDIRRSLDDAMAKIGKIAPILCAYGPTTGDVREVL
jgi:adenylosuccinate synthase